MTTSLRHRVSNMPEEFEAKESMEIAATSRVIRRGDCSPAPVTVSPPQSFFSSVPHWRHDGGLRLSAGSLPASPLSGILRCPCAAPVGAARQQARECRPDPTSSRNSAFPGLLDFAVDYANRCVVFGVRYKPYWIMSDVAALSALEGPLAKALGGSDISWIVGILVSGACYLALVRSWRPASSAGELDQATVAQIQIATHRPQRHDRDPAAALPASADMRRSRHQAEHDPAQHR